MRNRPGPDFDPTQPLVGRDGLEYEDFADYLAGKPAICWRNERIVNFRAQGRSEQGIRVWIEGYDKDAKDFAFREERAAIEREEAEEVRLAEGSLGTNFLAAAIRPRHRAAQLAVVDDAGLPRHNKLSSW